MSSAIASDIRVTRESFPEPMQLSDCVIESVVEAESPVAQFETALSVLTQISELMAAQSQPHVLGEMLIVSAVASVESYFRGVLSSLTAICSITRNNVRAESVSFGAATSYPPNFIAFSLLERSMFSTKGVIASELKRFTRFDVGKHPELAAAVSAFEAACTCRHAAAHWRGKLDSQTLRELGLPDLGLRRYQVDASYLLVQRVFAACDHLVHLVNHTLFEFTISKWIDRGVLAMEDPLNVDDLARCADLLTVFGSESGPDVGPKSSADLLRLLHAEE